MADYSELFRSTEEQSEPVEAVVTRGNFPEWIQGSLVRLGPGKFDLGDFVMNHWFDGYAVLYKFDIRNGKVKFSKKFLQSDAYKKAVSVGRPVFTEYGTRAYPDPCKNIFSRMMSTLVPELTDNDAINLFTLEDSVYAATETNNIRRVDISNLETCEKVDLNKLVGVNLASSHTFQDEHGTVFSLGTSFTTGGKYHIIKIPATPSGVANDALKKASILTDIPSSWLSNVSYYHSFGMSEHFIIFIEQPMLLNVMKLVSIQVKGKSLKECMEWHPEELNKFILVEKETGKIVPVKYKSSSAFFMFHHINTYEEDGHLVVDVIVQDSPDIVDQLFLETLRKSQYRPKDPAGGRRFVLPLPQHKESMLTGCNLVTLDTKATAVKVGDTVTLTAEVLSPPGYELPTINKHHLGKKYRYYYAAGIYDPGQYRNCLLKVDILTGEVLTWRENEYCYPGEAQFVASPESLEEDDGVLLAAVTDVRKGEPDFLVVLDAQTLMEISRAEVTVHIPNVLHGIFVPQSH